MTKEEFAGWRHMRETEEIMRLFKTQRKGYTEELHNLLSGCNEPTTLAIQGARLQGIIMGVNNLLEIEWEDVGGPDD